MSAEETRVVEVTEIGAAVNRLLTTRCEPTDKDEMGPFCHATNLDVSGIFTPGNGYCEMFAVGGVACIKMFLKTRLTPRDIHGAIKVVSNAVAGREVRVRIGGNSGFVDDAVQTAVLSQIQQQLRGQFVNETLGAPKTERLLSWVIDASMCIPWMFKGSHAMWDDTWMGIIFPSQNPLAQKAEFERWGIENSRR